MMVAEFTEFLDKLPIWGILLASLVIIFVSMQSGFLLGKRKMESLSTEVERPQLGPIVTASLTLLVFLIAVVFGSVEYRYEERKHIALEEANAIGTVYLRAGLLPETARAKIRQSLYEYVTLRIELSQLETIHQVEQSLEKSEALQSIMWSRAVTVADQQPTPISALFLQSLNQLIDTHATRVTLGIHYRLPGSILIVLYGLTIITMVMGGYGSGLSRYHHVTTLTLLTSLVFSVVLTLVVVLDRPWPRLASVTQEAMIDVQKVMHPPIQSQQ